MLAVYGIIGGADVGWFSNQSWLTLGGVLLLLVAPRTRVSQPDWSGRPPWWEAR